jgi:Trk K+ transport system NAD-binding subunit
MGGIAVVLAVMFVIRPLLVYLSTVGGDFTPSERLFVGFVGPRGIIPASVATLFAIELQAAGNGEAASLLVGTVFLVILSTVVLQGGLARHIAEFLDVIPMRVLVIGGGQVGREVARRLGDRGENVVIIENDETVVEQAREAGFAVHIGDGTDMDTLRSAGGDNARTIIAATSDDEVNLLVGQLATTKFDAERIICRVNDAENIEAFEELGVDTISSTLATAQAIDNVIERPAMARWARNIEEGGDVQEIRVTNEAFVGQPIGEVRQELPARCLISLVTHEDDSFVPEDDYVLEANDHITIMGEHDAVREAMALCRGE